MLLDEINNSSDVKKLTASQLTDLSGEIREVLLERTSIFGGHVGSNLGVVELTIALHYVFNFPTDKLIFDVSHQCYTHKILTGRKFGFTDKNRYDEVSGFFAPSESEYDLFKIGHTSTSLSFAAGLAKARDIRGENWNVIAVIGDGALSGGEAYEGLNNIIENGSNTIVILNDNEMSIAENYGGIYNNLRNLRENNGNFAQNFFKSLGFKYFYLEEGNDIEKLIKLFEKVKDCSKPVVIHLHTKKGKGYSFAENDREGWHIVRGFDIQTGVKKEDNKPTYSQLTAKILLKKIKSDKNFVVVTSSSPTALYFTPEWRKEAGRQLVDVGIAEEHAVTMTSALAKGGCNVVYPVISSFLQRGYDQLSQDLALNNCPATILVCNASIFASKDITHLGIFDITLLSNIPNLVYLAPTCSEEYEAMLDYATKKRDFPLAIRVPFKYLSYSGREDKTDYSQLNKFELVKKGSEVAIIGIGTFFPLACEVEAKLKDYNIDATLINPKFISGLDEQLLTQICKDHRLVVTLEDGMVEGGFGYKVSSFLAKSGVFVKNYGIFKQFFDNYHPESVLKTNRIDKDMIVEDIIKLLKTIPK